MNNVRIKRGMGWHEDELECVVCGCTESDCSECIEMTGDSCGWCGLYREPVCTACALAYYLVQFAVPYVVAMLATCTQVPYLVRARRFAMAKRNPERAALIEQRIRQLDPEWKGGSGRQRRIKTGKGRG